MSMYLEFEPHSWYKGFAIKHEKRAYEVFDKWVAYAEDGMHYSIIELHNKTLRELKQQITQYRSL